MDDTLFLAKKFLGALAQPLPLSMLLGMAGLYLLWFSQRQRLGKGLTSLALFISIGFSLPAISNGLLDPLEQREPALGAVPAADSVDYIVVLGGGHEPDTTLPLSSRLYDASLKRLLEGIRLQQHTGAKLIVSGGAVYSDIPEAATMAELAQALGVANTHLIVEDQAKDTASQAIKIAELVGDAPFLLVTSASHMPRAMALLKVRGLQPIAAPTDYSLAPRVGSDPQRLLPSARALQRSERAIHEYIGQLWTLLTN